MDTRKYEVGVVRPTSGEPWLIPAEHAEEHRSRGLDVVVGTVEISLGAQVTMRAFGHLRSGHVTKLGRTRVTAFFRQNRQGDTNERPFRISELIGIDGQWVTQLVLDQVAVS